MATTIKSAKGPMHQDIYPIIARSKDELEKCYAQVLEFIKEKGGVDVYRIPEGSGKTLGGLQDGDVIITPLGGKMDTKSGEIVLVATYTGDARDVLPHFRFKTKRKWGKESLPYPPAPQQHIEKYAEQETVKNRPDKTPPTSNGNSSSSMHRPGVKDIYTCDMETFTAKVYHYMSEFKKTKKLPKPDEDLVVVKIQVKGKMAELLKVADDVNVQKQIFSTVEVAALVFDMPEDTLLDEGSNEVQTMHKLLVGFLGEEKPPTDENLSDAWNVYRSILSLLKSYVELEFLSNLDKFASLARKEKCEFTSYSKEEYDKREMSLIDDIETDRDIITDAIDGINKDPQE